MEGRASLIPLVVVQLACTHSVVQLAQLLLAHICEWLLSVSPGLPTEGIRLANPWIIHCVSMQQQAHWQTPYWPYTAHSPAVC
jgi:hypothetical protein